MMGMSIRKIREKALRDVEEIRKTAAFIWEFLSDNTFSFSENKNPGLNVIAIIGPPQKFSTRVDKSIIAATKDLEKVVLTEIGIGATYPNHRAMRLNRKSGEAGIIKHRQKWFVLTKDQYRIIASNIFNLMEVLAYRKVRNWKYGLGGDPFYFRDLPGNIKEFPG